MGGFFNQCGAAVGAETGGELTIEIPPENLKLFAADKEASAMSVAEVVPGPIVREKVSRDSMVQRGFMLIIALYLVITLALPLYVMLSKAFLTYQFDLDQFSIQVSDESGNFSRPAQTMRR